MSDNELGNIFTIGFTQKSAETFFNLLRKHNVLTLLDVRLNNISQLSGFAKQQDLIYFLKELCNVEYIHILDWAPTKEMLSAYQKKEISWEIYEDKFLNLLAKRNIERDVTPEILTDSCLLCSEHKPHNCHRRLVVEYLKKISGLNLSIKHLI